MWMTEYINAIKRHLRDTYKFVPDKVLSNDEPCFNSIPDGEYPMIIDGKLDNVKITSGFINCCNFEESVKNA